MACATLKRSLDWETINQRPTKRRRCNLFDQSCGNASSPVRGSNNVLHNSLPVTSGSSGSNSVVQSRILKDLEPSPFLAASLGKISPDKMSKNLRLEIKRLQKRKQLPFSSAAIERMEDSESSGSEMGPESPHRADNRADMQQQRYSDKALFSYKQVQLICEGMLQDREDKLREEYDIVLTTKLAEQYDAFVKFTYDQIQRRYEAQPSYLS